MGEKLEIPMAMPQSPPAGPQITNGKKPKMQNTISK
jgi:hypothetical protein